MVNHSSGPLSVLHAITTANVAKSNVITEQPAAHVRFTLYGNRGEYRMPGVPDFATVEDARAYYWRMYPSGNRWIAILPVT